MPSSEKRLLVPLLDPQKDKAQLSSSSCSFFLLLFLPLPSDTEVSPPPSSALSFRFISPLQISVRRRRTLLRTRVAKRYRGLGSTPHFLSPSERWGPPPRLRRSSHQHSVLTDLPPDLLHLPHLLHRLFLLCGQQASRSAAALSSSRPYLKLCPGGFHRNSLLTGANERPQNPKPRAAAQETKSFPKTRFSDPQGPLSALYCCSTLLRL